MWSSKYIQIYIFFSQLHNEEQCKYLGLKTTVWLCCERCNKPSTVYGECFDGLVLKRRYVGRFSFVFLSIFLFSVRTIGRYY